MKNGVATASVESLCLQVTTGGTPSRKIEEYWIDGTIPWVKTGELKDGWIYDAEEMINELGLANSSAKIFPKNTVLMALYGDGKTITSLGIVKNEVATNQACCAMIVDPTKCDHRYLFYALKHNRRKLLGLVIAGAQRNLSNGIVKRFEINAYHVAKQGKIADILCAYDDLIENNRRRMALLEESARLLYREWFISLRFPGHERTKVTDGVPNGWSLRTIGDCSVFQSGGTPSKGNADFWDGDIPWISSGEMTSLRIIDSSLHVTPEAVQVGSRLVPKNTILVVVRRMSLAKEFRLAMTGRPVAFNQDLKALTCVEDVTPEFLFSALVARRDEIRDRATEASHGTKKLDTPVLATVTILLPNMNLQQLYSEMVPPMNSIWDNLWQQNRALVRARNMLLPRLMSGEISV